MDIFIPGIATGMNYGVYKMPVKKVVKKGNLLEAIIDSEHMKDKERMPCYHKFA